MNGGKFLLDTNAVLYILGGQINPESLPTGKYFISFIAELELLSYPSLTKNEEHAIKELLKEVDVININPEITTAAIALRKQYGLKIPDAIVCATSLFLDATLVTRDKDFTRVKSLKILTP